MSTSSSSLALTITNIIVEGARHGGGVQLQAQRGWQLGLHGGESESGRSEVEGGGGGVEGQGGGHVQGLRPGQQVAWLI